MGHIKSAIELAMERSAGLHVDKTQLRQKEVFDKGRQNAAKGLSEDLEHFNGIMKEALNNYKADEAVLWRQGAAEVFLSHFTLSAALSDPKDVTRTTGYLDLLTKGQAGGLLKETANLLTEYTAEVEKIKQAIETQMGPRIQQMAQQAAQQKGVPLNFVLERDPNYIKILSQNLEPLKEQYQQALDGLKEEIKKML